MTTPVPSVPDFLAGSGPQQSDMQSLWVNPAAFFQQRVIFRASQTSGATSLPAAGTYETITYNNIIEDPYSGWNGSTHAWTPPAGYSGWYQFTATVIMQSPGAAGVGLKIQILDAAVSTGPLTVTMLPSAAVGGGEATFYVYLIGGQDGVAVQAGLQNSSGAVSTNATATSGQAPTFEACWISG